MKERRRKKSWTFFFLIASSSTTSFPLVSPPHPPAEEEKREKGSVDGGQGMVGVVADFFVLFYSFKKNLLLIFFAFHQLFSKAKEGKTSCS